MARSRKVSNFVINKGLTKSELDEAYLAGQITDDQLSIVDTIETTIPDPTGNAGKFLTTDGTDAQWAAISTNIEWKTKVDLPSDYPQPQMASPYYVISGGLPDGEYEFYFSTKCANGGSAYPLGETIYKVTIKVDNTAKLVYGNVGYVFNGDYQNNSGIVYGGDGRYFYMFHYNTSNNDFVIHLNDLPFGTDALNYFSPAITIEDCFKMSAIKNKATGQEYIATGSMSYDNAGGNIYGFNGETMLRPITNQPYIPMCHATNNIFLSQADAQNGYVVINQCYLPINGYTSSTSTVAASFTINGYPGELTFSIDCEAESYIARIIRATGVLSNAEIGVRSLTEPEILVKLNATVSSNAGLGYSVGLKGSSQTASISIESNSDFTPIDITEVGGGINTSNYGWILQCGKETPGYTKGYFYEACGDLVTVPDSWDIEYISLNDVTLSVDTNALVQGLVGLTGYDSDYVRLVLLKNYKDWTIRYNADSGVVTSVWWQYWGEIARQDILGAFIIGATGYSGYISIQTTMSLVPGHEEVQNSHWERVNTQPEGDVIQVDPMPAAIDTPTGKIVQYVGTTAGGYTNGYFYKNNIVVTPASASISQTSGSGLTDLAVNLNTFVSEEQPSGSETVDFVCNSVPEDIIFGTTSGFSCSSTDNGALLRAFLSGSEPTDAWLQGTFWYNEYNNNFVLFDSNNKGVMALSVEDWAGYNIIITTDNPGYGATLTYEFVGGTYWTKSGSQVNPTDYGITYTGTPANQDILTVVYTAQSSAGGWDRIDVQPAGSQTTYKTYRAGWRTNSTTKVFCDSIAADTFAVVGDAYLGEVTCSDLPGGIVNSEIVVEIMDGTSSANKVIKLTLTSGNVSPYMWVYTYWNGGSNVSGWQTWATAAQGAKADTAVQPADLATVATTGNYADLRNLPDIPDRVQYGIMPQGYGIDGLLVQYVGSTDANYTEGYFYKGGVTSTTPASATATQTVGSSLSNLSVNVSTFQTEIEAYDQDIYEDHTYVFTYYSGGEYWEDPTLGGLDILALGISFTGTPVDGDQVTVVYTAEAETYGWRQIDVQPQGSSLPSQTGNAGRFLTTDGTDASWGDALVNAATGTNSLAILGSCINNNGVALGKNAYAVTGGVGVGYTAESTWDYGIAVGYQAKAYAIGAIQLGKGTNSTAGTMSVGLTTNGTSWTNYTLLDSDGTIPTDRFTTTPSADGSYVPTLTIASGVATRTWGTAPSGGSVPTLTWYTVSTAGSTLTIADTSSAQLVKIYKNGLLLQPTDDYSISGTTLTMVTALVVGDKITTEVF